MCAYIIFACGFEKGISEINSMWKDWLNEAFWCCYGVKPQQNNPSYSKHHQVNGLFMTQQVRSFLDASGGILWLTKWNTVCWPERLRNFYICVKVKQLIIRLFTVKQKWLLGSHESQFHFIWSAFHSWCSSVKTKEAIWRWNQIPWVWFSKHFLTMKKGIKQKNHNNRIKNWLTDNDIKNALSLFPCRHTSVSPYLSLSATRWETLCFE